jgi:sugar diacid utilization regulator
MMTKDTDSSNGKKRFAEYEAKLSTALLGGDGIEALLRVAATYLGNPLLIADFGFKLIAHYEPSACDRLLWNDIVRLGYYPQEYTNLIVNNDKLYERVFSADAPTKLKDMWSSDIYIAKRIVVYGKPIGFATCLEYGRALTDLDMRFFDIFCKAAGVELRSHEDTRQYHKQRYQYFLSELISGTVRAESAAERQKQVGLALRPHLYVLAARFRKEDVPREFKMEYYRSSLENACPGSRCTVYRNTLALLIDRDRKRPSEELFSETVMNRLEKFDMVAALSLRFGEIADFGVRYRQAMSAIRVGERLQEGKTRFFDCTKLLIYIILDEMREKEDLRRWCHPDVFGILEHDAMYDTEYAVTLDAFLRSGRKSVLTARMLHMHRNTIDYRIDRMSELFGIDFADTEAVSLLELSFRILRLLGNMGSPD